MIRLCGIVLAFLIFGCGHEYPYTSFSKSGLQITGSRIAILPFSSPNELGGLASDVIAQILMKNGFHVLGRYYLSVIMQEQGLSLSGITEPTNLAKIRKLTNADYIMVGTARSQKEIVTDISIKILDIKTGEMIMGSSYALERKRGGELDTSHARPLPVICETMIKEMLHKK